MEHRHPCSGQGGAYLGGLGDGGPVAGAAWGVGAIVHLPHRRVRPKLVEPLAAEARPGTPSHGTLRRHGEIRITTKNWCGKQNSRFKIQDSKKFK